MTRDDAPESSKEAPSETAAPEAAAGQDFDSATLAEWAADAEDAISKRLKGLRPETGPMADNAVFLWGISRLVRRQLHLGERGKILEEPFARDLVEATPISSHEVAEGLAWVFLLGHKDLPAWKISLASKLRLFGWSFAGLFINIFFQISIGNTNFLNIFGFFHIFYPKNILQALKWFVVPWNGLHALIALGCLIVFIRLLNKIFQVNIVPDNYLGGVCMIAHNKILAQMGISGHLRVSYGTGAGCLTIFIMIAVSLATTYFVCLTAWKASVAVYGKNDLWPMLMWPMATFFFAFTLCFGFLMAAVNHSYSSFRTNMAQLIKVIDEWRSNPENPAPPSFYPVSKPQPKSEPEPEFPLPLPVKWPKGGTANNDTRRRSSQLRGGSLQRKNSARAQGPGRARVRPGGSARVGRQRGRRHRETPRGDAPKDGPAG